MNFRRLGKTNFKISELSLGTWQVGGKWGSGFDHGTAEHILDAALDAGINFIDTADVYEGGESEKAVGKAIKRTSQRVYVATKCGRQISPHVNEGYTPAALREYVEASLKRLELECLDLIQLHCPPTQVYYRPEIFNEFDKLKQEGKILNLGVSVEKVEEALKAIEYDNVASVQIIYNMFRQRPHEYFFQRAQEKDVGVIVRVPLASGLLTGLYSRETAFTESDHRHGNRNGEWFDKGETFAGIPYEQGIDAVAALKHLFPDYQNLAPVALKWVLMHPEVSCVIPGASKVEQVSSNLQALEVPDLSTEIMEKVDRIYASHIREAVHHLW